MKKFLFIVLIFCGCSINKQPRLSDAAARNIMLYARQLQACEIDTAEFDYLLTFYRK